MAQPNKSNGWNRAHCPRHQGQNPEDFIIPTRSHFIVLDVQDQNQIFKGFIKPTQNCSRSVAHTRHHSDISRLSNYTCSLIQILQKTNFEFRANVFVSRVQKINFKELSLQIWILRVKSSEGRYYLEINTEDRVLEKWKRKKTTYIRK